MYPNRQLSVHLWFMGLALRSKGLLCGDSHIKYWQETQGPAHIHSEKGSLSVPWGHLASFAFRALLHFR